MLDMIKPAGSVGSADEKSLATREYVDMLTTWTFYVQVYKKIFIFYYE